MQIGYIPGIWDLLHIGHVHILQRCRSLCDRLIVGVPSDEVVMQDKGELPTICLDHRIKMLEALECVSSALPYYNLEFITHLEMIRPDTLFVGETWGKDQRHSEAEIWTGDNNCRVIKLPYTVETSTTDIKAKVSCTYSQRKTPCGLSTT